MAPAPASNTAPIRARAGAEILAMGAFVAACEVRTSDVQLCEHRWSLALPAIALAGQSAATYFMVSRAGSPAPGRLPPPPVRDSRGQFTRPQKEGGDPLVD
jgi:hypothetical protein